MLYLKCIFLRIIGCLVFVIFILVLWFFILYFKIVLIFFVVLIVFWNCVKNIDNWFIGIIIWIKYKINVISLLVVNVLLEICILLYFMIIISSVIKINDIIGEINVCIFFFFKLNCNNFCIFVLFVLYFFFFVFEDFIKWIFDNICVNIFVKDVVLFWSVFEILYIFCLSGIKINIDNGIIVKSNVVIF